MLTATIFFFIFINVFNFRITESPSNRGWKEPLDDHLLQSTLPKVVSTRKGCSGPHPVSFGYLQRQRLHRPSGQSVLVFNHLYSKKKVFYYV